MNAVEKLMKEYLDAEEIANLDLSAWPRATRPSMEMRQRDARSSLDSLKAKYMDMLRASAFTIFVTGEPEAAETFAKIAGEEAGTINVRADGLYQRLADEIEPSLGDRRTFGTTQLGMLVRSLDALGRDLDARNIPIPQILDLYHCPDRASLVTYLRELVRSTGAGDALSKSWIENEVIKTAFDIRYTRTVVPVILTQATEDEAKALPSVLFSGNTFTVNATTENTGQEQVLQALSEIKKSLKSKKT